MMLRYTLIKRAPNNNTKANLVLMVRLRLAFGFDALHSTPGCWQHDQQGNADGKT